MTRTLTPAFDLILFDLDGTLVETGGEIADAIHDTLQELGLPSVTQAQVERWIGLGTRELLAQALAHAWRLPLQEARRPQRLDPALKCFGTHYLNRCGTRSRLYPHVREALSVLRQRHVRLAVLTNKEARYTTAVLQAHGLTPMFDAIICGDTYPVKKPDPIGVQACLRRFGVEPRHALMVGDSAIDVATARHAGIAIWALPYGYNMGQPIAASQPDRVIDDFSTLLAIGAMPPTR